MNDEVMVEDVVDFPALKYRFNGHGTLLMVEVNGKTLIGNTYMIGGDEDGQAVMVIRQPFQLTETMAMTPQGLAPRRRMEPYGNGHAVTVNLYAAFGAPPEDVANGYNEATSSIKRATPREQKIIEDSHR